MNELPTLRATRTPLGRAPQQAATGRVCAAEACDTRLSRYNVQPFCNIHVPTRFPVQRGVESKRAA